MTNLDRGWLNFNPLNSIEHSELLFTHKPLLDKISDFEMRTYMNGDIHTKVDRATMKYSLEARSPFMDHRIVEFSKTIPDNFKVKNGVAKRILKDVLYKYIPAEFFDRRKLGFRVPFNYWFRNELRDWVYSIITLENLSLIPEIRPDRFMEMVELHMKGKWDYSLKIWKVINLINWIKNDEYLRSVNK
jgi:asparagine synthase (glutamine-hydrolysing)